MNRRTVIIGDSTHNTLSAVRSLGRAGIEQVLILKCHEDSCCVTKSKYLRHADVFHITQIDEALPILNALKTFDGEQRLMCTFDEAAMWVDAREEEFSEHFLTPARGNHIGNLFNKDAQCRLAAECGLTVPQSVNFSRKDSLDNIKIGYPILLKPLNSTRGEKDDIHICHNRDELNTALLEQSHCADFILQEFIDKEYEVNCLGMRNENGAFIVGGVKKLRHYPKITGACSFGLFQPIEKYNINLAGIDKFLKKANYHGPFSVEFLYRNGKYYFMEVNFRNDGLAWASTCAGANLHALYADPSRPRPRNIRPTYMMNYSIDLLYVKEGDISRWQWLRDFLRTSCFINISFRDLGPVLAYYRSKLEH